MGEVETVRALQSVYYLFGTLGWALIVVTILAAWVVGDEEGQK